MKFELRAANDDLYCQLHGDSHGMPTVSLWSKTNGFIEATALEIYEDALLLFAETVLVNGLRIIDGFND